MTIKRISRLLPIIAVCMAGDCQGGAGFGLPIFAINVSIQGEGAVQASDAEGLVDLANAILGGAQITLVATPVDGWRFVGWEGDIQENEASVALEVDAEKNITAIFVRQVTLNVVITGNGTIDLDGIGPLEPGSTSFDEGDALSLVAVPSPGWLFAGWEGDASGNDPSLAVNMDGDKTITGVFLAISGHRIVTVAGTLGKMTVAVSGNTIRGVRRSGDFAADLSGTISDRTVTMTSTSPGTSDAFINATIQSDGSWVGTITGSGFNNDSFVAEPVSSSGFEDPGSGVRTTTLLSINGFLAATVQDGTIRGTWRIGDTLGADIDGTVNGDQLIFTVTSPGFNQGTVTASIQSDGSWVGTFNGSGGNNEPITASPAIFP